MDAKAAQPERLKQLATLLTHPENGRFTRTLVNRLWHRLMGRGIVHPVDSMQTEPWSADLLDHLATEFSAQRYDLKQALELITTSQAYQSRAQTITPGTDDHGYTYAGPRSKRLTAEQFIDAIWQLTETAPTKMDAPLMRGKPDPAAAKNIHLSAQWIWGDSAKAGPPPAGETITLRKSLKLTEAITSASAVVTCDNEFTLYVNNRRISRGENWQAEAMAASGAPGVIVASDRHGVVVACGQGALRLTELQKAGGKRLPVAQFLAGTSMVPGSSFDPAP